MSTPYLRPEAPVVTLEAGALTSAPCPDASFLAASAPDRTETRVVLVKPGDLLLIGNVGLETVEDTDWAWFDGFCDRFGLKVVVFAEDIRLDLLPGGDPGV